MWAEPLLCGVQPRGGGSAEMEIWFPALCSTHSLLQGECFHSNAITGMLRGVAEIQTHSFRVLTRQRQTFIVGSESSVVGGISQRVAPPLCHAPTVSNIVLRTGTGRQHGAQPRTAKCRGRGLDENSPPPHSSTCKNYINKSDPLAFPWVSSRAVKQTLFKCFSKSSEMSQHLQLKVDVMMEHHNEGKKRDWPKPGTTTASFCRCRWPPPPWQPCRTDLRSVAGRCPLPHWRRKTTLPPDCERKGEFVHSLCELLEEPFVN